MSNQVVRLISFGKLPKEWQPSVGILESKLNNCYQFTSLVKKLKQVDAAAQIVEASDYILKTKLDNEVLIVCDETGKSFSSVGLATKLSNFGNRPLLFVIGSSHGLTADLLSRADLVLRLSDFVLAHDVARVVMLEQLYRSWAIQHNHPYHHV